MANPRHAALPLTISALGENLPAVQLHLSVIHPTTQLDSDHLRKTAAAGMQCSMAHGSSDGLPNASDLAPFMIGMMDAQLTSATTAAITNGLLCACCNIVWPVWNSNLAPQTNPSIAKRLLMM